jgi:hypothetical protein
LGRPVDVTEKSTLDSDVRLYETNRWLTGMGGRLYFAEEYRPGSAPVPQEDSLEARLLSINGVVSVYVYGSTVTVSKDADHSWEELSPKVIETIQNAYTYYAKAS